MTDLELPPLNPVPAMELSQFRPGERAVLVMACENYAKLYARAAQALALERAAQECESRAGTMSMFATARNARGHNATVRGCATAIRALKDQAMKAEQWRVTYRYSATGMHEPDKRDYGVVEASSADEAKQIVVAREYPEDVMYGPGNSCSTRDFFKLCLKAEKVIENDLKD